MRILIFTQIIRRVSGVQTFEKNLINFLQQDHSVTYVYKTTEIEDVSSYPQGIELQQDVGQEFDTDICIYSSIYHGNPRPNIKARSYIQVWHADPKFWGIQYNSSAHKIDLHIAVSETVQSSLLNNYGVESTVIPNIMPSVLPFERVLRLVTISRIAQGKGFDRIIELSRKLDKAGRKYIWEIYGDGPLSFITSFLEEIKGNKNIVLMGPRENAYNYIRHADYLVQLSDSEGFCYSIHEAIKIGIPCITTDFPEAKKIIEDQENGYILKMDLSNLNINKIYEEVPDFFDYKDNGARKEWKRVLEK